ncbi:hypothetical protein B0H16DRAFT_1587940 [Mycena metata]|uniref:Uncharacterized protein n=1 Tax=Mycena metata TaxID=1033252 RepID=A0AAD7HWU2_9AGAR|nr:hypothetical protein B0H16DRAFT_1587940 [Mycena metata]
MRLCVDARSFSSAARWGLGSFRACAFFFAFRRVCGFRIAVWPFALMRFCPGRARRRARFPAWIHQRGRVALFGGDLRPMLLVWGHAWPTYFAAASYPRSDVFPSSRCRVPERRPTTSCCALPTPGGELLALPRAGRACFPHRHGDSGVFARSLGTSRVLRLVCSWMCSS